MYLKSKYEVGDIPLSEYPRPQFVRDGYICLNGVWDFTVKKVGERLDTYDKTIIVPFSPETLNSGIGDGFVTTVSDRLYYQKKFDLFRKAIIARPQQGWLKTIREFLGMTTTQLAKRLEISQPRIVAMEKNERNVKISTMERIADVLNCDFSYAFVPRENIDDIIYNQAKKKAQKILDKVNKNMGLENQLVKTDDLLKDIIEELLDGNIARIWDEDE